MQVGKKFFEIWTTLVSDEIISTAHAFGERFFLQAAINAFEEAKINNGVGRILGSVIYLHMITYVNENIGWYLKNRIISAAGARDLVSK